MFQTKFFQIQTKKKSNLYSLHNKMCPYTLVLDTMLKFSKFES